MKRKHVGPFENTLTGSNFFESKYRNTCPEVKHFTTKLFLSCKKCNLYLIIYIDYNLRISYLADSFLWRGLQSLLVIKQNSIIRQTVVIIPCFRSLTIIRLNTSSPGYYRNKSSIKLPIFDNYWSKSVDLDISSDYQENLHNYLCRW